MNKEEKKIEELKEEKKKKEKELPKKKKKESQEEKLLEQIENLKKESSLKDEKILRITAEMQNIKRRAEEEKGRLLKYDGEEIITKILIVLDNFEHAIKMDDNNLTDEVSKFLSGFKMIYGNMLDTLKSIGVEEIDALHKPFDDTLMNAVLVDSSDEFDDNIVLDVLQKGYMYKDKVIRPAMVKVNQKECENNAS